MACGEPHGILTRGQPHTWRVTCKLCENTRSYRALRRMEQERAFGVLADDLQHTPHFERVQEKIHEYMRNR